MVTAIPLAETTEEETRLGIVPPPRLRREARSARQLTLAHAVNLLKSGRLTARDLRVLRAVWMLGAMTSDQIRRLVFHTLKNETNARRVANRRLRFLYQEYCLDRIVVSLNQDAIYTLDVQGARIVQMLQQAKTRKEIKWSPGSVGQTMLFMDHRLEVAEFAVRMAEAARGRRGTLQWIGEAMLDLTKRDGSRFEPDGMGVLKLNGHVPFPFFLEWDRGKEAIGVIGQKMRNYLDYLNYREGWSSHFSEFPLLLFVTTGGDERLRNVMVETERQMRQVGASPDRFVAWMTTQARLDRHGMFGKVWYQAGKTPASDMMWEAGSALPDALRIANDK